MAASVSSVGVILGRRALNARGFATSSSSSGPNFGLLFDIDGVIVRGRQLLPLKIAPFQSRFFSKGDQLSDLTADFSDC